MSDGILTILKNTRIGLESNLTEMSSSWDSPEVSPKAADKHRGLGFLGISYNIHVSRLVYISLLLTMMATPQT